MPNLGINVSVRDWCVEVETMGYVVDDNGNANHNGFRTMERFRIDDCRDKYSEDTNSGERSITLLHLGKPLVTFSNQQNPLQNVFNTLNGMSETDIDPINDYFRNEFYQFRVRG